MLGGVAESPVAGAAEGNGRDGRAHAADDVQAEAVERQVEAIRVGPSLADDVVDLVLAPGVLGADEAQRAQRPGIVRIRPRDGRDLVRRIGRGQQAREIGKRIGRVAREVPIDAAQA